MESHNFSAGLESIRVLTGRAGVGGLANTAFFFFLPGVGGPLERPGEDGLLVTPALPVSFRMGRRLVPLSFRFACFAADEEEDELEDDDPDVSLPESLLSESLSLLSLSWSLGGGVGATAGGCLRRRTIMVRFFLRVRVGDFLPVALGLPLEVVVVVVVVVVGARFSPSSRLMVGRAVGGGGALRLLGLLPLLESVLRGVRVAVWGLLGDEEIEGLPSVLALLGLDGVVARVPVFFLGVPIRFRSVVPLEPGDLVGDLGGLRCCLGGPAAGSPPPLLRAEATWGPSVAAREGEEVSESATAFLTRLRWGGVATTAATALADALPFCLLLRLGDTAAPYSRLA